MARRPVLDLSRCSDCEACIELCPEVFRRREAGYVEVVDSMSYPEDCIQEAINCCPADCIAWEEPDGD